MPQRHLQNNNDLAFFAYDEKRKLGYGTQKERLGKDSIKPFDDCCLCLKSFIDPMSCQKWPLLLNLAAHAAQQKQEKEEEEERLMMQKPRELDEFDQQNLGAVPLSSDRSHGRDKNGYHGANSVNYFIRSGSPPNNESILAPPASPEAPVKVGAPSTSTVCWKGRRSSSSSPSSQFIFLRAEARQRARAL